MASRFAILAAVALLTACPSGPVAPPGPDADAQGPPPSGDVDAWPPPAPGPCADACAALARLRCPEGASPALCALTLGKIERERLIRTSSGAPLTCEALAQVTTVATARTLGVTCPQQ
jgi:hypothetical protein